MTDPVPCKKCGLIHERCTAHNSAGAPCRRHPNVGQRVCAFHGGNAPQAKAAAERRVREAAAAAATQTFGLPQTIDPHEALLAELHRTAGEVAWLGQIVAALDADDVTWGRVRDKEGGDDRGTTYEARPNAWVQLWHQQRRHFLDVAKACVAAGIEERRVRLAEDSGRMLASVVRAVLDRLELTPAQLELVPVVVPEELRRVATTPALEEPRP